MKNLNMKIGALVVLLALGTFTSCQQEDDNFSIEEEISAVKESAEEDQLLAKASDCDTGNYAPRDAISGTDYNIAVSSKVDDRSCAYDYYQWSNFGVYRLRGSDNNLSSNSLQTRIERATLSQPYGNGKYVYVDGYAKISNAGVTDSSRASRTYDDMNDDNGTYFAQVKGRSTKQTGSTDPAICLFIAKPERNWRWDRGRRKWIFGGGSVITNSSGKPSKFRIYAEIVKKRGGSGSSGRNLIYLTTVNNNSEFKVYIKSRFGSNGNHYIDYDINGARNTFTISRQNTLNQSDLPTESRIRIGAYRCKGGEADIRFKSGLNSGKN